MNKIVLLFHFSYFYAITLHIYPRMQNSIFLHLIFPHFPIHLHIFHLKIHNGIFHIRAFYRLTINLRTCFRLYICINLNLLFALVLINLNIFLLIRICSNLRREINRFTIRLYIHHRLGNNIFLFLILLHLLKYLHI